MYKLLIVDDEELVREAIKEQMDWEKLGYRCAGDCEDGAEALEFVERETPDIVLTDIGMPFMDGLELTRELSLRFPQVKVVILTGYDDFDYARQAVKLQAVDYILKPITSAELEGVLLKLKEELDHEGRRKRDYEQLRRQLAENMPLLRERFLERFVSTPMAEKAAADGCAFFGIAMQGPFLVEAAIRVDEFAAETSPTPSDQELYRFAVYNIAQEIAARHPGAEVFRDVENRVLALFSGDDAEELQERSLATAEEILKSVSSYLPLRISVGIGHTCRRGQHVPAVHQSALSALDYRFVTGGGEVIRITDMECRDRPALLSAVAWENELITKLKTGTARELDEWVDRLFAAFREHLFPIEVCYLYLQRIVLTLLHTLYETDGNLIRTFGEAENPILRINRFAKLDEMEGWMKGLCADAVSAIQSKREDHGQLQVEKAIAYVKEHYQDPDLSLKSVCKHISMSVSYFSTLFKQHTGKTFVEHVTQERMEKAKELLKLTAMKNYEIAYAVGYSDPHYFSGAFKKHEGDTPTDYRLKMSDRKA
ncbi:response regulator transcription factor [Cohnella candidum]|nr:response regulator transcription factor [Cohnella candidum]